MGRKPSSEVSYSYGYDGNEAYIHFMPQLPVERVREDISSELPQGTRLSLSTTMLGIVVSSGTSGMDVAQLVEWLKRIAARHHWQLRRIMG